MAVKVKGQPIETKPVAGLSTNALAGYIIALVFAIWPNFAARVPDDLKLQLPVIIGTVLGAIVAYFAQHTNRPDLGQGNTPALTPDEVVLLRERLAYDAAQRTPQAVPGSPDVIGNVQG